MSVPPLQEPEHFILPLSSQHKPSLERLLDEFSCQSRIPSLVKLESQKNASSPHSSATYALRLSTLSIPPHGGPAFLSSSNHVRPQEYPFTLCEDTDLPAFPSPGERTSSIRLEGLQELLKTPLAEADTGFILLDLLTHGGLFSRLMPKHPQSILPVEARSYELILPDGEFAIYQFLPVPLSKKEDLILLFVKPPFLEPSYFTPFALRHHSAYYVLPRDDLIEAFQHVLETDKEMLILGEAGMINRVLASYNAYLRLPFEAYYAKLVLQQPPPETLPQKLSERWAALRRQYREDVLAVQRGERT